MISTNFDIEAATEATAYLLNWNGGEMDKSILLKLLYMLDRKTIQDLGSPVIGGSMVSFEHGPLIVNTYDLTSDGGINYWTNHIETKDNRTLALKNIPNPKRLSKNAVKRLRAIFDEFGNYTFEQMREYTHVNFTEYEKISGSYKPILFETMLGALGLDQEEIKRLVENQEAYDALENF